MVQDNLPIFRVDDKSNSTGLENFSEIMRLQRVEFCIGVRLQLQADKPVTHGAEEIRRPDDRHLLDLAEPAIRQAIQLRANLVLESGFRFLRHPWGPSP